MLFGVSGLLLLLLLLQMHDLMTNNMKTTHSEGHAFKSLTNDKNPKSQSLGPQQQTLEKAKAGMLLVHSHGI